MTIPPSIPFHSTQHFYVREDRLDNFMNGTITAHPFCCIGIGYMPIAGQPGSSPLPEPFRVAAVMLPRTANFCKASAILAVKCMLDAGEKHTVEKSIDYMMTVPIRALIRDLGFTNINTNHPHAHWDVATKALRNVVLDMQGLRINDKGDVAPRARRRDDPKQEMSEHDKRFGVGSLVMTK
jgi:hypothetical protein